MRNRTIKIIKILLLYSILVNLEISIYILSEVNNENYLLNKLAIYFNDAIIQFPFSVLCVFLFTGIPLFLLKKFREISITYKIIYFVNLVLIIIIIIYNLNHHILILPSF